ncbi:YlxM family DNA-binding protein [Dethiobacter alkaliphilus]|uniref:YlxM family DNA-binding protein n=1 Tax=Dethiobacter alkaliphilus TaxID=427926 RepID=UPI002227E826|nr:putative DNA-binding protein [Dethiobacter alkaliphilus]MCW3489941.1 putative DNA-binding protein [Dethiobacter alkaliphilus]
MLEDTTRINMLYDFYGNLLTDKQRECLELYYQDDLSLAEIADNSGISRQGVHDLIKRAVKTLEKAEEKLALVKRFMDQEKELRRLRGILAGDIGPGERREALAIVDRLLD